MGTTKWVVYWRHALGQLCISLAEGDSLPEAAAAVYAKESECEGVLAGEPLPAAKLASAAWKAEHANEPWDRQAWIRSRVDAFRMPATRAQRIAAKADAIRADIAALATSEPLGSPGPAGLLRLADLPSSARLSNPWRADL